MTCRWFPQIAGDFRLPLLGRVCRDYCQRMQRIGAVLIDIDGVLTVSWEPISGAVAAVEQLRAAGISLALVTNTTSRSRASIAAALGAAGFPVTASDILTAPAVAAAYLREHYPGARCLLLNSGDIAADLTGIALAGEDDPAADVVLIGGTGPVRLSGTQPRLRLPPGWRAARRHEPRHVLAHQRRAPTRQRSIRRWPGTGRRDSSRSGRQARRGILQHRPVAPGRHRPGMPS